MLGGVGVERLGWAKGEMQTVQHGVYLDVADVAVASVQPSRRGCSRLPGYYHTTGPLVPTPAAASGRRPGSGGFGPASVHGHPRYSVTTRKVADFFW